MSNKVKIVIGIVALAALAVIAAVLLRPIQEPEPADTEGLVKIEADSSSYGGGEITALGDHALSEPHQQLILQYMDTYYESLFDLRPRDFSTLFSTDAYYQSAAAAAITEVYVTMRKQQPQDLRLMAYSYSLTVTSVSVTEEGELRVLLTENSVQNFVEYPGLDSKTYNFHHEFRIVETADGPKLCYHYQQETLFDSVVKSDAADWTDPGEIDRYFAEFVETLVADSAATTQARLEQLELQQQPATAVDVAYDRAAALSYAEQWVFARNPEWPVYDNFGGNCANFTSQCLLAGGIPMDYTGNSLWKWYGEDGSTSNRPYGRSKSWSAVEPFYDYVNENTGFGLVALADAPFYTGQPGDIIHMGRLGEYKHAVMITNVVKDEYGNVTDYIICCNTADREGFPASAYGYQLQRLIIIYGWNHGE